MTQLVITPMFDASLVHPSEGSESPNSNRFIHHDRT